MIPISRRLLIRFYRAAACLGLVLVPALLGQQNRFQGSVPMGTASPTPLALTLRGAIDRGLRTNLGLLVSGSASDAPRRYRGDGISDAMVIGSRDFGALRFDPFSREKNDRPIH